MKKGWSEVALGEVLHPQEETCRILTEVEYREVTVSLWGKGVRLRRKVSGSEIAAPVRNVARTGDFIVSKIDARNGAYGVIPEDLDGAVVTNDFPLYAIAGEQVHPRWIYWLSRSRFFVDLCRAASEGTTNRVRLQEGKFAKMQIPLPPLAEQQRLTARLDAIEARLTRVQKLRTEQEQELEAALHATFHRMEAQAEWRPLHEVAPLVWRQVTIQPETIYSEYGVRSFYKGIFLRRKVAGSAYSWQELYTVREGDVVFSNIMAWEKGIAVAAPEHDGWVGNHRMLVCEPRRDIILPGSLHRYFMTAHGFAKVLEASPGTAARNKTLKADRLMAIPVPVPPMKEQRAFEDLCQKAAAIRSRHTTQTNELEKLLPSLLDQIFND